jgi:AcrR family transcriptional regulator
MCQSMARTQSPDYDKRRDAILSHAARLYAKHGFLGASVAELAKACKTSKSLIYHYYPSKEDILFGVMSTHLEDLAEIAIAAQNMISLSAANRLEKLTQEIMQAYVDAAARHKVLLNELENLPADKRKAIVKRQREIILVVETLLRDIKPELSKRSDLALPLTMLFFGMVNWTHTWFNAKGAMSATQLANLVSDLLLNGLTQLNLRHHAS